MKGSRICAVFSLVLLFVGGFALLLFACIHYSNWWSIFIFAPCFIAFITPAICYGYDTTDIALMDVQVERDHLVTCRELGWSVSVVLALVAYSIPVLAWYNSGFYFGGVLVVDGTLMCWLLTYVLWLRVFVFK